MGSNAQSGSLVAGRYRLEERLGEGGMGVVWRAGRLDGGDPVAIKLLKGGSTARFLREARAAAMVSHPNVVVVHEVVALDERPAIVMELLLGETLAQRLAREQRLGEEETASILTHVAAAVGAAHALGIVHRDLKPANVFLAADPAGVKVLDFGLAKWTKAASGAPATLATASGALLGTPCYMSPEQAFGERDLDHRTDLWSLGIILYECLSGVLPTRAENIGQVLKIVLQGRIRLLGKAMPAVSPALAALAHDLLRTERDERPADMRDVISRLRPFTRIAVAPIGPPLRRVVRSGAREGGPRSDVPTLDTDCTVPPAARARSQRWAVGAIVAGALGGGAYLVGETRAAATSEMGAAAMPESGWMTERSSPRSIEDASPEPSDHAPSALSAPKVAAPRATRKPAPRAPDGWPSEFGP
jgi:eukaryotic-like serine/threonine-protein kinase